MQNKKGGVGGSLSTKKENKNKKGLLCGWGQEAQEDSGKKVREVNENL